MLERPMKPTVEVSAESPKHNARWKYIVVSALVTVMAAMGLWLAFHGARRQDTQNSPEEMPAGQRHGTFSQGRKLAPNPMDAGAERAQANVASESAGAAAAASQTAQQNAERLAAAQQAQAEAQAQTEQLAAKQRELEQIQAIQEAQARKLAEDDARLQADRKNVLEAKLEAEKANAGTRAKPAYSGPSSGMLVWQGEVKGTTLVTITGSQSDEGRIISGSLPGVLVLLQPSDSKRVTVASAPSPSNGYQRLTMRVQGNGTMQESIHWSLP